MSKSCCATRNESAVLYVRDVLFLLYILFFLQEVKEFLGEYKAKNILISKKFKHGMIFYCCLLLLLTVRKSASLHNSHFPLIL